MEPTVRRTSRSYVRPAADTPSGSLELSAVDRFAEMRHMVRSLHVFRPRHRVRGEEEDEQQRSPARVVREALAKALVDYYPFAGRLVDGAGGPATARVECTGEGAWFVEAVAGCSLEDVAFLDHHPFAIPADDLLPDAAPGVHPVDIPLMMQVTEFTCGGFVVGLSSSHTLTDGLGAGQFINAVADYARGLPKPRVSPIWARELMPSPRKLLHSGPSPDPPTSQSFRYLTVDLSSGSIDRVRSQFHAATGQHCTTFDVAVAMVWQARTRSLRLPDPSAPVSLCFFANGAGATAGFYGNCFYPVTTTAEAGMVGARGRGRRGGHGPGRQGAAGHGVRAVGGGGARGRGGPVRAVVEARAVVRVGLEAAGVPGGGLWVGHAVARVAVGGPPVHARGPHRRAADAKDGRADHDAVRRGGADAGIQGGGEGVPGMIQLGYSPVRSLKPAAWCDIDGLQFPAYSRERKPVF